MISRNAAAVIALIAFALGALVGVGGYLAVTAGSGEASISASDAAATVAAGRPTTAATTVPATTIVTPVATLAATTEVEATVEALVMTAEATVEAVAMTAEATVEAQAVTTEAAAAPDTAAAGLVTYRIDSEQSEVRFIMQEDLRGQRVDVIGITKDVGGDILVNRQQPQNSQVNPIVINARTLVTDQNFRNQALRSRILRSAEDAYEFITFTPTAISGLPTSAITEGPVTFQITGDLKIVEVTRSVTFDVTISEINDTQLSGTGTAEILWADYNLTIPEVPSVANITPEVTLEIDFVAEAVE